MMKKTLLILFTILLTITNADELKKLNSLSDIPNNKISMIIYTMDFCQFCAKQKDVLDFEIIPDYTNIEYFEVKKGTQIADELKKASNYDIRYYPTTIVVEKRGNNFNILWEFFGFKKSEDIVEILNDKEIVNLD